MTSQLGLGFGLRSDLLARVMVMADLLTRVRVTVMADLLTRVRVMADLLTRVRVMADLLARVRVTPRPPEDVFIPLDFSSSSGPILMFDPSLEPS